MASRGRLGSGGYGISRLGSFAGKAAAPLATVAISRLGSGGYGVRRMGSFAGKTTEVVSDAVFNYPIYTRTRSRR